MKCPDCKIEMTATTAQGLQLLVPQHDEPGRRNIGKQPAQIVAHVCPKCGKVELRVLSPGWFAP